MGLPCYFIRAEIESPSGVPWYDFTVNMPTPRDIGFTLSAKIDTDHVGDTTTKRSRTDFHVFLNYTLIYWMSKKQTRIESSSFGSEFTVMKQSTEYLRDLRYNFRIMELSVNRPVYIYGNN